MSAHVLPLKRIDGVTAEISDEALLAACATGDRAALAALFDRHQASVQRFLARLAGVDPQDAEDLLQNTFIEVFRSAKRFLNRSSVRSWVFGIAANLTRNHVRSSRRRRELHLAFSREPVSSRPVTPERSAERQRLRSQLERAIADLPYKLRVVFVMCDVEGIRGVEAARILKIREGTLYRRLHDARKRLRVDLGGA